MSGEERLDPSSALHSFGPGPKVRRLLERIEARHRESALILGAHGNERGALRAERSAARVRLMLDEPGVVRRMHAFAQGARDAPHHLLLLERALEGAMSLLGTDLGNVQVRQPATGELRIAAQSGFDRAFLEHFALVSDSSTACGPAAARGSPTVIADVDTDPGFAPHRDAAAASGFRAVQSTPLVDHSGRVRGVISTHFRRSRQPNVEDLRVMGWYGELIGCAFAAQQRTPTLV